MNHATIENEARRLQVEMWSNRALLFPIGVPPIHAIVDPRVVANFLNLEYELLEKISAIDGHRDFAAAGSLNRQRGIISISAQFNYNIQRFTGAHEIGHWILHPHLGRDTIHRDLPITAFANKNNSRSQIEKEADYFAACLLAPRKLVLNEFKKRFGEPPLVLTEHLAFHLMGEQYQDLYVKPQHNSLNFAAAVAGANKYDRFRFSSLADQFGMSVSAMAIRLKELGLIKE